MKHYSLWRGGRQSIRTRVLAIALVPSAALLAVGVGASIYLVGQGLQAREWSSRLSQASLPANQLIQQVSEERRMSLLRLTGDTMDTTGLTEVRTAVDGSLARLNGMSATLAKLNPSGNTDTTNGLAQVAAKLPVIRAAIDTRTLPRSQALAFYNGLIGSLGQGLERIMGTVKDSQAALAMPTALDLLNIADATSRSNALAAGALSAGGMTPTEFASYRQDVSGYHLLLPQVVSRLTPHGMAQYKSMVGGVAWQRVV